MRELDPRYKRIAERLIKNLEEFEYIRDSEVRIAYLSSDEEKTKDRKLVHADCTKVDKKYSWCVPYDFFITVYEPNCLDFSKEQMEILMKHELHHIGIDNNGNEPTFHIIPHDVEEFWSIINAHGLDWNIAEKEQ